MDYSIGRIRQLYMMLLMVYFWQQVNIQHLEWVKNTYLCILPVKSSIIKYFVEVNMSNVLTNPNLLLIYNPLGGFIITLEAKGSDYIKGIAVPFLWGNHFHRIFWKTISFATFNLGLIWVFKKGCGCRLVFPDHARI